MSPFNEAYLRHQQSRWMRPDAARFLKPGTKLEDVFPALALKYSPSQPRVPSGSGRESGRWTDGNGGSSATISQPMANVGVGDIDASESDGVFNIGADEKVPSGDQIAADDSQRGLPIDLIEEEEKGGHGIAVHVSKSERFLKDSVRDRASETLGRGDQFQGLSVGSFTSMQSANRLVNSTISQNRDDVRRLIVEDAPFTALNSRFSSPTGYEAYLDRAYSEPYIRDTYGVRVVLFRDRSSSRGWRVQSAFPIR